MARFAVAGTGIAGRAILLLIVVGPESPATRQVLLVHYPTSKSTFVGGFFRKCSAHLAI